MQGPSGTVQMPHQPIVTEMRCQTCGLQGQLQTISEQTERSLKTLHTFALAPRLSSHQIQLGWSSCPLPPCHLFVLILPFIVSSLGQISRPWKELHWQVNILLGSSACSACVIVAFEKWEAEGIHK